MHLAGRQCRDTRGGVIHDDQFDTVHEAAVGAPVVLVPLESGAHASLIVGQLVGAGADAGRRVVQTAIRLDDQMVVGQDQRQVGIALSQGDDQVAALVLDGLQRPQKPKRTGFRLIVRVALQGGDYVGDSHFLAVVKFYTLADLECPGDSVGVEIARLRKRRQCCARLRVRTPPTCRQKSYR